MQCIKCGTQLEENAKFCEVCGTPVQASGSVQQSISNNAGMQRNEEYSTSYRNTVVSTGDMKTIRKYFMPKRPIWPVLLTIISLYGFVITKFTIIFTCAALACWIYMWFIKFDYNGESIADSACKTLIGRLTERGKNKLSVIDEQVSIIDPVVVIGYGATPDESFEIAKSVADRKNSGLFILMTWPVMLIKKLLKRLRENGTEADPIELYRIGSDDRMRSMLIEVTVFWFTDSQVLRYRADADISTQKLYCERTNEIFYQDIESINFQEKLHKVYNPKKKKFINEKTERMALCLGGDILTASINMSENDSALNYQFSAMRNLIRERKRM